MTSGWETKILHAAGVAEFFFFKDEGWRSGWLLVNRFY